MESIKTFERKCAQFPAQYTPEWFARVDSVGGSEMHKLMTQFLALAAKKIYDLISKTPWTGGNIDRSQISTVVECLPTITELPPQTAQPSTSAAAAAHQQVATMDEFVMMKHEPTNATKLGSHVPPSPPESPPIPSSIFDLQGNIKEISMSFEVATGWGTLFEPVSCNYIMQSLKISVYCRSVSLFDEPFRFSPDGIICDSSGAVGILEMKNPLTRIWLGWNPQKNRLIAPELLKPAPDEVPLSYTPQLQLGLHLIPFASYAYYVEFIIRRANGSGRATAIGVQRMREVRDAPILDSGVIGFYHKCGTGNVETAYDFSSTKNDLLLCHVLAHQRDPSKGDVFTPLYFTETLRAAAPAEEKKVPSVDTLSESLAGLKIEEKASAAASTTVPDVPKSDLTAAFQDPTTAVASPVFKSPQELPPTSGGKPLFGYMFWQLLGAHAVRVDRDENFITPEIRQNATFVSTYVRSCIPMTNQQRLIALRQLRDIAVLAHSSQETEIETFIDKVSASQPS